MLRVIQLHRPSRYDGGIPSLSSSTLLQLLKLRSVELEIVESEREVQRKESVVVINFEIASWRSTGDLNF
jgi:hypothetical protein